MIITDAERSYWVKIENLAQYKVEIPNYHPEHPKYLSFWKEQKRKCVEGMWGVESNGYRYCPGTIYFYGNFYTIKDVDKKQKTRKIIKPLIRDIEWHRAYNFITCQGFSGFELDDETSCDKALIDDVEMDVANSVGYEERLSALYKPDGTLKKYEDPLTYVKRLHKKELGKALFWNKTSNIVEIGSRSGGKSYWYSGLVARELLLDGQKYYDPINKNGITVAVGSGNTDKSSELAEKIKDGIDALSQYSFLGVYGQLGDEDYAPNPLYKNMTGSIEANNKATNNAYRHEYKVKYKGEEQKRGTKSTLYHISYSTNKKGGGAESAAGGRYNISIVEEAGLMSNVEEVHYSNRSVIKVEGVRFGVECYIGTSGNMELAQGVKKMFENPLDYECLSFDDVFEGKGKIGFFLPSYMVDSRFKDADGNTDLDKAKTFYLKELDSQRTAEAKNAFKMNTPIYPSHMWITKENSILPKKEATDRYEELIKNQRYKEERTFVKLKWKDGKAVHEIIDERNAIKIDTFRASQGSNAEKNKNLKSTNCDFIIYEFPHADAKEDSYKFIGLDPYVADETTAGESLGAMFILKSPKYIHEGQTGDIIVAEYVAKPGSRDDYSRNVELLLSFYNNPKRALMFETNRGEKIEEYFKKVNKEYLLAYQPYKYVDGKVKKLQVLKYGYTVGNHIDKLELLNQFAEWLLSHTTIRGETKLNIQRISSLALLDEIINYDYEADKSHNANYDRISAMLGCMVARKEGFNQLKTDTETRKSVTYSLLKDERLKNYKGLK